MSAENGGFTVGATDPMPSSRMASRPCPERSLRMACALCFQIPLCPVPGGHESNSCPKHFQMGISFSRASKTGGAAALRAGLADPPCCLETPEGSVIELLHSPISPRADRSSIVCAASGSLDAFLDKSEQEKRRHFNTQYRASRGDGLLTASPRDDGAERMPQPRTPSRSTHPIHSSLDWRPHELRIHRRARSSPRRSAQIS